MARQVSVSLCFLTVTYVAFLALILYTRVSNICQKKALVGVRSVFLRINAANYVTNVANFGDISRLYSVDIEL